MTMKWWISEDASIPPLRTIRRTIHVIYYPKYPKAPQFNTKKSKDLQLTLDQFSVPGGWFHDRAFGPELLIFSRTYFKYHDA
ncbi:uncharacterized protein Bfra_006302 [Botrytis fragariae]|uniref:Uncharacterized protein n=1 Tax=Botrytis fragariae TaxID=1964551 RepID=A0A8H6B519_9HELO|nr:uncharacterized protein Bfra_006302 [Botrytis fragariae]KAF5879097.1 hypothetical protein Bfra_006302 [Botrytis fragariae]